MSHAKRLLCFGDSLTWGWVPVTEAVPTRRYPFAQRWTGIMAAELGDVYEIVEEGLSGRTTNADDPTDPRLNGSRYLPSALASHLPLDLAILMLGTNDTKAYLGRSPFDIATGMSVLVDQVARSAGGVGTSYPAPRVLVVAPPPLGEIPNPWFAEVFKDAQAKTTELARHYQAMADFTGVSFVDAGQVVTTDGVDGIHFTQANNQALGSSLADAVSRLL
ncbi:SGNH/GDSL hydrolase family protein [Streptomyces sp. 8N616]|uniref:SGNH/GDSL hydrolase family protein n=1 Tax=Streptomyces sp. 8N616 TaxID=3457414 RepID=UPI003FD38C27